MGAPVIPFKVPAGRMRFLTMRTPQPPDKAEAITFWFLSDSNEYFVDDEDRELVLELDPGAKFYTPPRRRPGPRPASAGFSSMKTPISSVRTVSASSPEGKALLAQVSENGEPLWKTKALEILKKRGARRSPLPPSGGGGAV